MRMLLSLILFLSALSLAQGGKVVPCIYSEEDEGKSPFLENDSVRFTIEDLDATNCSHIFYSSKKVRKSIETICLGGTELGDEANDGQGSLQKLLDKKRGNRNLKIFPVVHVVDLLNWSSRNGTDTMTFTSHLVTFLQRKGFDGMVELRINPFDEEIWSKVVEKIRRELEEHRLSLMIIITTDNLIVSETKYDAFFVPFNCHNYYKYLLSQSESVKRNDRSVSTTERCIQEILDLGVDPSKILMPLLFQAVRLDLQKIRRGNVSEDELRKNVTFYNKVCSHVQNESWEILWDEKTGTSFLRKDKEVIVYESPRSIAEKIKFIKQKQLSGVFGVVPGLDDFGGTCGQGKYPLLSAIGKELLGPTLLEPADGSSRTSHTEKYIL